MTHDPAHQEPVYHTATAITQLDDLPSQAWVRFGRQVIEAHQPEGDTCRGCGRIWACCPVVVAAHQNGLSAELILTGSLPLPRRAPSPLTSQHGLA